MRIHVNPDPQPCFLGKLIGSGLATDMQLPFL
jgi:hypothetical protein